MNSCELMRGHFKNEPTLYFSQLKYKETRLSLRTSYFCPYNKFDFRGIQKRRDKEQSRTLRTAAAALLLFTTIVGQYVLDGDGYDYYWLDTRI